MMYNIEAGGAITQKQNYISTTSPSTPLRMNKNSQNISKLKPKIRIIHIFAPEIIKTDVANFRELVQRLTGKPSEKKNNHIKKRSRISTKKLVPNKLELIRSGYCNYPSELMRENIKGEEEDIWRNANYGEGFLGGFQEFDGFMQDFNQLPLLPNLDVTTTAHLDAYGETPLA
ncbi:VQ motif-containing protein 25-like [Lycium barbarum]|uniref:VQ motif-containing protein 25-like n=1 Tax=Lycium barbarum TaxID=112863 RepID=UPI00293E1B01|nr:VQ motif-containing protein 25-like [Lycium barbarum]